MKTVDYFLIPLSIVMFVLASLVLYFWMPIPREIKCSELISADKPASDYPYLAQGLLFATGTIFFLVVTSVGEWKWKALRESSKKKKWIHVLRFQAAFLIGLCFVVGFSVILGGRRPILSSSFVDACKPNPPVSSLCGNNILPKTKVNVTCTTHSRNWIPALSYQYLNFTVFQTYLMLTLIGWTAFRVSSVRISLLIGVVAMGLLSGIGTAARESNETDSSLGLFIVFQYVFGGIYTLICSQFLFPMLTSIIAEEFPELPTHVPKQKLPNPEPLKLRTSAK